MRLKEGTQLPTALKRNGSKPWLHVRALKNSHALAASQTSETRMSDTGAQASELLKTPWVAQDAAKFEDLCSTAYKKVTFPQMK